MATMYKLIGPSDGTFELKDTAGAVTLEFNGEQILADQQTAIADLAQTISGTYSQAEVQAISTKVDAILALLRTHGLIASS